MNNLLKSISIAGLAIAFFALQGCTSSKDDPVPTGRMDVRLVDGPITDYKEINVNIQSVQINRGDGWITLSTPQKTYDLLKLRGGVSATLVDGATLAEGNYNQMRLVLGSGNTVKLLDDSVKDLTIPSGIQTGIKLNVHFDVVAGTTKDVWIDFDAAHSIHMVGAGASGKYLLRPVIKAFDKLATGSISGTLTDEATALPLAGATVYAQSLDTTGEPSIARSTLTGADGTYTLDLLPIGGSYYVVSQPKAGGKVYSAKVGPEMALTDQTPIFTFSAAFTATDALGHIAGTVTPVAEADQGDHIFLRKALAPLGSAETPLFIVETTTGIVTAEGVVPALEGFAFMDIPAGDYSVKGQRVEGETVTASLPEPVTLAAGESKGVALAF